MGNTDSMSAALTSLKYVNFASARDISGKIDSWPSTLTFANFREARFLWGTLSKIAGTTADCAWPDPGTCTCKLVELNIRNAQPGLGNALYTGVRGFFGR